MNDATAKKRVRRDRDTVRALILDAARELFSQRGYAGTPTREIAARAQVSEVLLFRHFKSKAQLFEQAVFEPLDRFIREFQQLHTGRGDAAPGSVPETRDFMEGLHKLLSRHRHLLMAVIAAEAFESEVTAGLKASKALKDYFDAAESYLKPNQAQYRVDLSLSVRLCFATALGAVLFQDWLFAGLPRRARSEGLVDQMTLYMLGGIQGAQEPVAPKRPRGR
jgi:AcrR family transcriptional regulator